MGPCLAVAKEGNNSSHAVKVAVDLVSGDHLGEVVDFLLHDLLGNAFAVVLVGTGLLDEQGRQELCHVEGALATLACIRGVKRAPSWDELAEEIQL